MEIEPTAEDRERALARLANPREHFIESLAKHEARLRIQREQREEREQEREKRRARLRKLSFGLFGR